MWSWKEYYRYHGSPKGQISGFSEVPQPMKLFMRTGELLGYSIGYSMRKCSLYGKSIAIVDLPWSSGMPSTWLRCILEMYTGALLGNEKKKWTTRENFFNHWLKFRKILSVYSFAINGLEMHLMFSRFSPLIV